MRSRVIIIVAAVVLGVAAAVVAGRYLQQETARIAQGAQAVTVLVAQQDLPAGMTAQELLDKGYVTTRQIPREYVAATAVSSRASLTDKVVAIPVSKDQQITDAMFRYGAEVGLASATPKGFLAVSIPYDAARGVAGLLKPGDFVAVLATFEPGSKGVDAAVTRIILPKAKVLAVGQALTAMASDSAAASSDKSSGLLASSGSGSSGATPGTITLALAPSDAQKLVFAQEEGKVWLGLYSPTDPNAPTPAQATLRQIVRQP